MNPRVSRRIAILSLFALSVTMPEALGARCTELKICKRLERLAGKEDEPLPCDLAGKRRSRIEKVLCGVERLPGDRRPDRRARDLSRRVGKIRKRLERIQSTRCGQRKLPPGTVPPSADEELQNAQAALDSIAEAGGEVPPELQDAATDALLAARIAIRSALPCVEILVGFTRDFDIGDPETHHLEYRGVESFRGIRLRVRDAYAIRLDLIRVFLVDGAGPEYEERSGRNRTVRRGEPFELFFDAPGQILQVNIRAATRVVDDDENDGEGYLKITGLLELDSE